MGGGGLEKSLHTLTWGECEIHSYVIFSKSIFYISLAGIIFHLRLESKKRFTMSSFLLFLQRMNNVQYNKIIALCMACLILN